MTAGIATRSLRFLPNCFPRGGTRKGSRSEFHPSLGK